MSGKLKVCLAAGSALGSMLLATEALAQAAPSNPPPANASAATVGEVVVTARGRTEALQKVPVADTAFSAKQIDDAHIREVGDFINLTPSVTVVQDMSAGGSLITIRGITQVRNSESPVAVVVDGVEEVNPDQFAQELFDVQSIEVLRGPQGALYGRDAEGGAILITTKQPTNAVQGYGQLGGGSGGEFNAQGVISGPIIQDQLFGRLGISYVDRAGYFENTYLNKKQDPFQNTTIQGLLKWEPTSKFSAALKFNYSQDNGGAINFHFEGAQLLPNGLINPANPVSFTVPGNANLVQDTFNSRDIGVDHRTMDEVSLKLSYDLGFATLSSITAWNHVEEIFGGDGYPYGNTDTLQLIPGTNLFDVDATATQYLDVDAKSEEIRLTSPSDQRFRWMVGGYYLYTDRYISTTTGFNNGTGVLLIERSPAGSGTVNPTLSFLGDDNHNVATAAFVNFDYDLTSQLQLSAAFRYDQDQRTQYVSSYNTAGAPGAINKATFGAGEPKFTVTYTPVSALSFYGSWGVGFRSGEFNQNGAAAAAAAGGVTGVSDKVPQETAQTGEVGFKSNWFHGLLSVSGDVYRTNVTNQQYFVFIGAVDAQVLVPINQVTLTGGELEAKAHVAPGLDLFGGLGVTHSVINKYVVDPADVGHWAPYVPDITLNLGGQYRHPISDSLVFVTRADYRLLGKQYWDPENATARNPVNLVDLSVGIEDAKGRWTASVKADNLLNTRYNAEFVAGGYTAPANPTVVRGELRVNF